MRLTGRWRLSPLQLDIVRKYLGLDELTLPLETRSFGRTLEEFQRLSRPEYDRMRAEGIVVDDEIAPALDAALRVLASPYLWLDSLWFPQVGSDHVWRALAAPTEGETVVLGVQTPSDNPRYGGLLTVEVHRNVAVSRVLLATLPPAPPGNRGQVRVPASSLRPVEPPEDFGASSVLESYPARRAGSGDRQVAHYEAIGNSAHSRLGQIAANTRDRYGRIHRSSVLHWFDNSEPDGRYLNHSERGTTGEEVFLLSPADAQLLGTRIDALIAQLR